MLKMKRKHIVIMTLLVLMVFSMAMTAYAATAVYEIPANTTAVNVTRRYTNVVAGRVSGSAFVRIVNQGTGTEYFTGKFGSSTTSRQTCDGRDKSLSSVSITGGTVSAGIYRTADTGTTMQGVLSATITY